MNDTMEAPTTLHQTVDSLEGTLNAHLIDWRIQTVQEQQQIEASVVPCSIGDIRIIALSGQPFLATRGSSEIASDGEEFIGVLYQKLGSTYCFTGGTARHVKQGEVAIWRCDQPAEFSMPGAYDKLCMMIPAKQLDRVLPYSKSFDGTHLSRRDPLAALLGSYLTTLSDEFSAGHSNPDAGAVDVTFELLASALRANRRAGETAPRSQLFNRILDFAQAHLEDASLTPAKLAEENGISARYLYLLFSEHGETVSGWIRKRRLEKCHSALTDRNNHATISEIAYRWGFLDSAHFSRLFKARYGSSPKVFRQKPRLH